MNEYDEVWHEIPGWEGWYSVSDHGRLRRDKPGRGTRAGTIHKLYAAPGDYCRVTLRAGKERPAEPLLVHLLVAEAFLGPKAEGLTVNHKDGDKRNNWLGNLEYVTYGQNNAHAYAVGLRLATPPDNRGERHWRAALSEADVFEIRRRHNLGESSRVIAKDYPVSDRAIRKVVSGEAWGHIAA